VKLLALVLPRGAAAAAGFAARTAGLAESGTRHSCGISAGAAVATTILYCFVCAALGSNASFPIRSIYARIILTCGGQYSQAGRTLSI